MPILIFLYITTSIFGIGVTIIDLIGLIGIGGGDNDSDSDSDTDFDTENDIDTDTEADMDGDDSADSDHDMDNDSSGDKGSILSFNEKKKPNIFIKIVFFIRCIVYFSFGFGPVGLAVILYSQKLLLSFLFSLPTGIFTLVGALIIKRIQKSKLDSQLTNDDLFMAKAKVIVSIKDGKMGKVRINIGNIMTDRYAMAEKSEKNFMVDDNVRVVKITDDIVYVENENEI